MGTLDQRPKHHRRGPGIVERRVGGSDVEAELFHEPGEARRLSLGQLEDEPCERGRVDDRMLERAFQPAPDQPGVERVMAVLDQHGAMREAEEGPPRIPELGRPDEHRPTDVMAAACIWIYRGAAVDQRVEERKRAAELEPLRPDLEDQERSVAGRLDVEGDELGVFERCVRAQLRRIDRDLLPGHRLRRAARLEHHRPTCHHRGEHAAERWTADLRRPGGRIALLPPALLATRIDEYALLRCSAAPSTAATWTPNLSPSPLINVLALALSGRRRSRPM